MNAKLKQKSVHALLLAFVVASILFLLPYTSVDHDSGFTSSDLEVKETVEENVTNASYVNSDGVITDAIDMGYATVQRTRNANGQVTEEFYLDAAGNPVERYGDYYGISYEYNSENVVIRYLGADKQPMMLGAGYSAIVRTLVDGKATDDFYYDLNMQPVRCTGGYYGLYREYDEQGKIVASLISVKMDSLLSAHLVMPSRRICVIQKKPLLANDTLTQEKTL